MPQPYPKLPAKPAKPAPAAAAASAAKPPTEPITPTEPTTEKNECDTELSKKFQSGWNLLGDLLRGQFRKPATSSFKDSEERDWWLIRGDVARISVALEQENWPQFVYGCEQLLGDVGVDFSAEQMKDIARAIVNAADTLPLVSGTEEKPPPALPSEPEEE